MRIGVLGGAGYVGLITGLGFAELGNTVVNADINPEKIRMLAVGRSPIDEEDLEKLLRKNLEEKRITFTTDIADTIRQADILFIAVGTPEKENGEVDLSQVIWVAQDLSQHIEHYKVIVMKSTVPVGTTELVSSTLKQTKREGEDFDIVVNPEFLREGQGLYDFFHPTRIIMGTSSERARRMMRELYAPFLTANPSRRPVPWLETDIASAQMIKYASNAFLATRISFINEIAGLCDPLGVDVEQVAKGMGYDPRIGHEYLKAGIGFGGPCLEKDLKALIKISEDNDHEPLLLKAVLQKNDHQVKEVIAKIKELAGYPLYKKAIAVLGLAFKAGTNDVRNSLSLRIIHLLKKEGAVLKAYDPRAIPAGQKMEPGIEYCKDPYEAAAQAAVLVILTDWEEFCHLDYRKIKARMASANIVDGKNLLEPRILKELGFTYRGMGR